ncbi:60S ribosomal protein L7AE (nucleomorph) [Lotharella oceanica]|uniref:60S ribosomal protein L7AE n=1 Tax=Lotharella oceanica TaxID=641309 RepID=A0A060DAP8_9EUKA|nr:60S ribosomal protein L7AE [Lotharella oceanica]
MLKRSLVWNARIIKREKNVKKKEYLKIFFKKIPKKMYQIIYDICFRTKHMLPNRLVIYRIKDILNNCSMKKIKLLVFSRDISNFELIIWIPVLCKIFKIPFFITNSKNTIIKFKKNKNGSIFGILDDFDNFIKKKKKILNNIIKINYEFYFSDNLIYY